MYHLLPFHDKNFYPKLPQLYVGARTACRFFGKVSNIDSYPADVPVRTINVIWREDCSLTGKVLPKIIHIDQTLYGIFRKYEQLKVIICLTSCVIHS
jgi:hypothetical protein